MIEYRFNRIPGAETKAERYNAGYKGTMFPWERFVVYKVNNYLLLN